MYLFSLIPIIVFSSKIVSSQIISVTSDVQTFKTNNARNQCLIIIESELSNNSLENGCPTRFDELMCWKAAQRNSTIIKTCPDYYNGFKKDGKVSKSCNNIGKWSKTDYSGCVPSEMWSYLSNYETMNKIRLVETLGSIGYGISVFCLVVAIGIMLKFRKLRCNRNTIHIHLFISFLLRGCIHFFEKAYGIRELTLWACKLMAAVANFLIEASYTWVFIEALYLHNTIFVHVLSESKAWLWFYIGLGWGLPFLVICILTGARYLFDDTGCWIIDNLNISRWILICYPTITIVLNVFFFVNITREIFIKIRQEPIHDRHRYRRLTKSTFILVLVFGLYHLLFIPVELNNTGKKSTSYSVLYMIQLYYTHLFVTFQGFIVAFLFCFFNGEVIKEVKRIFFHSNNGNMLRSVDCRYTKNTLSGEQNRLFPPRKNNSQYLLQPNSPQYEMNRKTLSSVTSTDVDSN